MTDRDTSRRIACELEALEREAVRSCAARARDAASWTAMFDAAMHAGMVRAYRHARVLVRDRKPAGGGT